MATVTTATDSVRVATLNMWGVRGDWKARQSVLVDGFAGLSADVLTLQEVIVTPDLDQARAVLGPGYHLVHQGVREPDGQGVTTASRWPVGHIVEVDLDVTDRTVGFACTSLITEILAPEPFGRIWLVNHFPSWRLELEYERGLQAAATARTVEQLLFDRPGHVVVAGDFDSDPDATSTRFWTGRHALGDFSVCYRDVWESAHPGEPGHTYVPDNPHGVDWDWPFRRIDYVMVRCGTYGGPTLAVERCERTFDQPHDSASDHYGLVADLRIPPLPRPTGEQAA